MTGKPLTISHVITKGSPMGGSQIDTLYCLQFQQSRHHIELVMGCDGPLRAACEGAGIPSRVIPMRNTLVDPVGDARALLTLIKHFRHVRPDVVHTHCSKAGVLGRIAARVAGVPTVVHTLHVLPFHDRQHPILHRALACVERLCSAMTDRVVAVAPSMEAEVVERGICDRDRVCTVISGLDVAAFELDREQARRAVRAELGIGPRETMVVTVANLEPRKRHDVFVEAARRVADVRPDVHFVIVGEGETRVHLERQIRHLRLEERVHLAGRRDDVPSVLAAADVFVQASSLEGLSRAIAEAMLAELPVIATNVNNTADLVQDGETGLLVPPGQPEPLAVAVVQLLDDAELRRQLGSAGRHIVQAGRSIDAMGQALDHVYGGALRRSAERQRRQKVGLAPSEATAQ